MLNESWGQFPEKMRARNYRLGVLNGWFAAPAEEHSRYLGAMNTFIGMLAFAPFLGGVLADALGYRAVFLGALVFVAASWVAVGRLERRT
ncbi:hypothetical protein [Calidithermus chliarophilus]|uniref:hypothetical protein n=1 Tax=Calidithermus chliarophilus TaxID=52023 RepID=UPI0004271A81|nr:hypothetical protein [Calidithermus chliarophilus]